MRLGELAERIAKARSGGQPPSGTVHGGCRRQSQGIITRGDVLRALDLDQHASGAVSVLEGGSRDLIVAFPDERISEACATMLRNDIGRLPVVDRTDPRKLVGYLGRQGVMAARLPRLHEEQVRESGWITGLDRPQE